MFSSIYDSVSEHCTPQGVVDDVASNTSASSSSHLHNHCRWVEKKYEGMTRWSDSHEDGEATHSMSSCNSSMASEPHNAEEMHPNIGNNIMCSSSSNNTTISTSVVDDDEEEKDDEEEAYIPIDYDEELEDCSQYTFSKDSVVWGTSLTGEGCNAEENEKDVAGFHVSNSYDDVDPFSVSWWHQPHTADESHLPPSPSRYQAELSDADACQGLRLLLREACRNNMLQIKHTPSYAFGPDYDDGDAAFLPATHQSGTQRKLAYLCKTRQEWQQLACHMTSELDRCPSNHRALLSALSNLSIFSNDHHCILRELSSAKAEEARRARRERAEQIISTLKTQQRLFLLPVLRAYEEEPATEVPLTLDVVAASAMMKMEEVEEDVVCSLTATPSDRSPACTSHRLSSPYSSFPGLSDEDLIHVEARAMSGGGGSFLLYEVEASGTAAAAGAGRMHGAEMYSWITNNVDYPSLTTSMSEGRLGLSGRLGVSGRRGLDCSGRSNWSSRRPSSGLLGAFVEVSESAGLFRAPSCTSSLEEICPSPVGMEEEAEEGWGMWSVQKDAGTSSSTEQHNNHCNFPMFCGAR